MYASAGASEPGETPSALARRRFWYHRRRGAKSSRNATSSPPMTAPTAIPAMAPVLRPPPPPPLGSGVSDALSEGLDVEAVSLGLVYCKSSVLVIPSRMRFSREARGYIPKIRIPGLRRHRSTPGSGSQHHMRSWRRARRAGPRC